MIGEVQIRRRDRVGPFRRHPPGRMRPVAKKTLIIDDLNGDTGARSHTFAFEGVEYEIDLTDASFAELRRALRPYLKVARTVGGSKRRPVPTRRSTAPRSPRRRSGSESATIRAWARAVGVAVPERGRIPATVRDQWLKAGSPVR